MANCCRMRASSRVDALGVVGSSGFLVWLRLVLRLGLGLLATAIAVPLLPCGAIPALALLFVLLVPLLPLVLAPFSSRMLVLLGGHGLLLRGRHLAASRAGLFQLCRLAQPLALRRGLHSRDQRSCAAQAGAAGRRVAAAELLG